MTDTYRDMASLELQDPGVNFTVSDYGHVRAELSAHRTNNRGVTEYHHVVFDGLDLQELECIARSANRAYSKKLAIERQQLEQGAQYVLDSLDVSP